MLQVQEPIPIPHLLQLRQNAQNNRSNNQQRHEAPPLNANLHNGEVESASNEAEDTAEATNGEFHHGNNLLADTGSNPPGDHTPRAGGLLNVQAKPYTPRGQLQNGIYTQQQNHRPNSGVQDAPRSQNRRQRHKRRSQRRSQ